MMARDPSITEAGGWVAVNPCPWIVVVEGGDAQPPARPDIQPAAVAF
jgi:hypothetical protein